MNENTPAPIDGEQQPTEAEHNNPPIVGEPTNPNARSSVFTGTSKGFFSNKGWKSYAALGFIVVFGAWGVYALLTSFAATPSVAKNWSTASDWNSGVLAHTVVAGNAVTLTSTIISNGTACVNPPIVLNNSGRSITDSTGAKWTVSGGVVYKNGSKAGFSANVTEITYVKNVIWQENSAKLWWSWNGSGWSGGSGISASPLVASTCVNPPIVLNNSGRSITDSTGAKWTVSGGVVYKNGSKAGFSANVTEITYVKNVIWQENSAKLWWSWNGSGWSGGSGISSSPITGGGTTTTYASSGTITLDFNAGATATWNALTDRATKPNGTTVAIAARTSTNNSTWSAWTTKVSQAAASQYLQIKVTLTTSNTTTTPSLTGLTLTYTPPQGTPTPTPTPTPAPTPTGTLTLNCNDGVPTGTNTTVNFCNNLNVPSLNSFSVGDTISEFGYPNQNIANSSWRNTLAQLGPMAWRLALRMNGNTPVAGAGGGNGDGTAYINEIRQMGGVPVVIAAGKNGDYDIDPAMSANLVHYFDDNGGQHGGPIKLWIIGNEPDNGGQNGINQYVGALNATAGAMKRADGSIQISAPAAAYFDDNLMASAKSTAGQYLDYMSYHAYTGADNTKYGTGVYTTPEFLTEAQHVKNTYGKTPAVEESNWHFDCAGNGPGYTDWEGGVYIASMIGNSLAGGAGHAYMYADSGGCGTLYSNGTPMPAYYGLGVWTGMNGKFDRFGSQLVDASVGGVDVTNGGKNGLSQQVELFATNNGKIVAINKNSGAASISIGLGGVASGTYSVWQTDTTQAFKQVQSNVNFTGSKITITLPGHTVSSIDVGN